MEDPSRLLATCVLNANLYLNLQEEVGSEVRHVALRAFVTAPHMQSRSGGGAPKT